MLWFQFCSPQFHINVCYWFFSFFLYTILRENVFRIIRFGLICLCRFIPTKNNFLFSIVHRAMWHNGNTISDSSMHIWCLVYDKCAIFTTIKCFPVHFFLHPRYTTGVLQFWYIWWKVTLHRKVGEYLKIISAKYFTCRWMLS